MVYGSQLILTENSLSVGAVVFSHCLGGGNMARHGTGSLAHRLGIRWEGHGVVGCGLYWDVVETSS